MTPIVDDSNATDNSETYYQFWQNQLLAEMGISRWVSQDSPVIEINEHQWQSYQTNQTQSLIQIHANEQPVLDDVPSQSAYQSIPSQDNLQTFNNNIAVENLSDNKEAAQQAENSEQQNLNQLVIVERFAIQAVIFKHWVLLVDEKSLENSPRQAKLWQNIQNQLKITAERYRFPLLDENEQFPESVVMMMHNQQIAIAGFEGFLYRLVQSHKVIDYQLGAISELSDCLDSQPIQRLPYLSEMVEDYRLKRQLWRVLIGD